MFNNEIKSAGFVMFWRNDERIDTLPLDTQGFYFQLVRLVCHADGAKSYDGKPLLIGQYGTSLARISDRFGLSIRQVRTHFKRLSDAKIITSKSDTRKTIVTICDYSTFHQNNKDDRHTKRQTNDTPNDKPTTHIEEELLELKKLEESSLCANKVEVKEKPEPKKTPREQAEEKGFLELWEAGKNKSNRQSAERKFLEAIKEVSLEVLVSQRKAYNLDMEAKFKGRDVNYQGIDVWLNKRRWEDEHSSSPKQKEKSYKTKEEQIAELTPELKDQWDRYQEKKRRQQNYED